LNIAIAQAAAAAVSATNAAASAATATSNANTSTAALASAQALLATLGQQMAEIAVIYGQIISSQSTFSSMTTMYNTITAAVASINSAIAAAAEGAVLSVNGQGGAVIGLLTAANNLSDLSSPGTARSNLGLGSAAVLTAGGASGAATLDSGGVVPGVQSRVVSVCGRLGPITIASTDITDATTIGKTLMTAANAGAVLTDLGGTTLGVELFEATSASAAVGYLGGTTIGAELFTAANAAAAISAIGAEAAATANGLNTQTASYVLVAGDAGKIVEMNVATPNTCTVPPWSSVPFAYGANPTRIDIVQTGAGATTIVAGAGVTLLSANGYLILSGQYMSASLYCRALNTWVVCGALA